VGLARGPLSLVRIIEELLDWKSSGFGQENRINDRGDPLRWPRDTLYPQKLALTSPTSGGRSVGIVRLRTKGHGVYLFIYLFITAWTSVLDKIMYRYATVVFVGCWTTWWFRKVYLVFILLTITYGSVWNSACR
jgi:hypothetical protein